MYMSSFLGKVIAEDSPKVLLKQFNVSTIGHLLYCISVAELDNDTLKVIFNFYFTISKTALALL